MWASSFISAHILMKVSLGFHVHLLERWWVGSFILYYLLKVHFCQCFLLRTFLLGLASMHPWIWWEFSRCVSGVISLGHIFIILIQRIGYLGILFILVLPIVFFLLIKIDNLIIGCMEIWLLGFPSDSIQVISLVKGTSHLGVIIKRLFWIDHIGLTISVLSKWDSLSWSEWIFLWLAGLIDFLFNDILLRTKHLVLWNRLMLRRHWMSSLVQVIELWSGRVIVIFICIIAGLGNIGNLFFLNHFLTRSGLSEILFGIQFLRWHLTMSCMPNYLFLRNVALWSQLLFRRLHIPHLASWQFIPSITILANLRLGHLVMRNLAIS